MAFVTNPDGSTKWIFAQLSDFNGFAVVDFATHKEINRIKLPDFPPGKAQYIFGGSESHGMAVTADQKMLVVNSRLNSSDLSVFAAGLEAHRKHGSRPVAGLGDTHAGRQDGLCGLRRVELGIRGRHQVDEGNHEDSGGAGPEAQHHRGAALKEHET